MICPISSLSRKAPESVALLTVKERLSYRELDRAVTSAAEYLKFAGIKKGERVLIRCGNSIDMVVVIFALFRFGAVACPVNFRFPENRVRSIAENINAGKIVSDETGDIYIPGIDVITISEIISRKNSSTEENINEIDKDGESTVILTSGSSGEEKAVLHTFGNHIYSALGSNENIAVGPGDIWLLSLPLFHVGGLGILFRVFLSGASVFIPESGVEPGEVITGNGITHVSFVEAQLKDFVDFLKYTGIKDIKRIKAILTGGGPIPGNLLTEAIGLGLPVYSTYGMTEMSSQVTTSGRPLQTADIGHSGKSLRYRKVRIKSDGEILVGGETLFKGYIKNGTVNRPFKGKMFSTGDTGYLDSMGNLHVKGRVDNMFISGGENIFPEEIERELLKMETVIDATVIPVKDERFGFRPVAFLKCRENLYPEKREIVDFLSGNLPSFKIPDRFIMSPDLPTDFLKKKRSVYYEELKKISPDREIL